MTPPPVVSGRTLGRRWVPALVCLLMLGVSPAVRGQFSSLETEHLRLVVFGQALAYLGPHAARCFENALAFHMGLFGYQPDEKTTVLLYDFRDHGNASAGVVPTNSILVSVAPFSYVFETTPGNERLNWVLNHELVHILASDMAAPRDRFFRRVFQGKVLPTPDDPLTMVYSYLTTPRLFSPRWYHEGIAVFMETWMSGGLGRVMGGYDEMVFRSLVRDGRTPYDMVGLESEGVKAEFQVGVISYLYGARFFSYLALHHGPESVVRWVARSPDSRAHFAAAFQQVYGRPLDQVWAEWLEWERGFQEANLATIRRHPVTVVEPLSDRPLGSVSRAWYDPTREEVYLGVNRPGQIAHLAAMDLASGQLRRITDVKGPSLYSVTSLAHDPATNTLFFTTNNNNLRDLYRVGAAGGKPELLMHGERVGDLAFNPADSSLWGVRHAGGLSTLVRIDPPYGDWRQMYTWPYGQDVYDLAFSPDGRQLAVARTDVSGRQALLVMDTDRLRQGEVTGREIDVFDTSSPANFVFTPDGRYLVGSSYYSGVSNLYRVDLEDGGVTALSNTETGLFRPVPLPDGRLLVFEYGPDGFRPARMAAAPDSRLSAIRFLGQEIVDRHPVVKSWAVGSPAKVNLAERLVAEGEYNDFRQIRLTSVVPVVHGYKDAVAAGVRMQFSSHLGLSRGELIAGFSPSRELPDRERVHLKARFDHMDWRFTAAWNPTDFYDLFGPSKTSRKGYMGGVRYRRSLIYDEPNRFMDWSVDVNGYGGLDQLPEYQDIGVDFERLFSLGFRFSYKQLVKSLGAVEDQKGFHLQAVVEQYLADGRYFPRAQVGFDTGFTLPIDHSSIWFYTAVGASGGIRRSPLSRFYFGGFRNNYVDWQAEKRYRQFSSFPGLEINEIGGREFARALAEWNLPPVVFRRLGNPSLYLNWTRLSLFAGGLGTDLASRADRRWQASLGAQLDTRLVALTHYGLTLSVGGAVALRENRRPSRELMISLKIM